MNPKRIWQLRAALFIAICLPTVAFAQGVRYDNVATLDTGRPAQGIGIRVCSAGSSGNPCTPTANVFSDSGLTAAITQPGFQSDQQGNYNFYAACGKYDIQISGNGVTTRTMHDVQVGPCAAILEATGVTGLPAQTSGQAYIGGGFGTPVLGAFYCGDGTGWRWEFRKRISSTDTTLGACNDSGLFQFKRFAAIGGTALTSGKFTLSSGWGTTASISAVAGTDQAFTFTVSSSGTGQAASPTITILFADGTWPNAPVCVAFPVQASSAFVTGLGQSSSSSATQLVLLASGFTPTAAQTYSISIICMGK